ncbi:MAG: hypothetical protein ACXWDM_10510 [Nocardioides sp.]
MPLKHPYLRFLVGGTRGAHTRLMVRGMIAGGLIALAVLATSACSEGKTDALDDCRAVEDRAYPAVRDTAKETLDGLTFTIERNPYCEETGEPKAVALAFLPDHHSRSSATQILTEQGWTRLDSSLISPNGHHRASLTVVGGDVTPARHIMITFADTV